MVDKSKSKWEKFAETRKPEELEDEPNASAEASLEEQGMDLGIDFPERDELESKLTEMEQRVDEYKDKSLRLAAQMKNMQERAERDLSKAHKFGIEKLLSDMLPVLDSFTQGIEAAQNSGATDEAGMLHGMQLTFELLTSTLKKHGLEVIAPQRGDAFNPEVHEAMTMQEDAEADANTVLQVLQLGYALNGRVLRAARVIVAK